MKSCIRNVIMYIDPDWYDVDCDKFVNIYLLFCLWYIMTFVCFLSGVPVW